MSEFIGKNRLRVEAEKFLSLHGSSFDMFDAGSSFGGSKEDVDARKLVHELQVHKVELEMQNAMLSQALVEAEELRRKYAELYQCAPVGYLTLLPGGEITELNQAAQDLLSLSPKSLLKTSFLSYVASESLAAAKKLLQSPVGNTSAGSSHGMELTLRTDRLMPVYVRAQANSFMDRLGAGPMFHLVLMDITSLHLAVSDVVQAITQPSCQECRTA